MLRLWLHRRYRPERYRFLSQLLRNQRLDAEALQQEQARAIDRILRFAASHSDFYAERFAGRIPHRGLAALEPLPVLTRVEVQIHRDRMLNREVPLHRRKLGHTGGSTGTPLSFWYDDQKIERMRAGMMRGYMWSGWRPGEKILNFWGAKQDLKSGWRRRYKEFVSAERTLGAWEYGERELKAWTGRIRSWRPVLLQGYASVLADVADYLLRRRLPLPRGLKGVYSTAEVLHDHQRDRMESAFGCPVFNQYGSREVPNLALQCREGGMHVFTDLVALESVVREGEPRLLVTSLTDRVMPFIRYENGDSGRLLEERCRCGLPFPLMELGVCRSNDIVRTASGRRVYPSWFVHLLDGVPGIRRYQFVQQDLRKMVLKLEAEAVVDGVCLEALRRRVREELGLELEINKVSRIERSASGKHRFVIGYDKNP